VRVPCGDGADCQNEHGNGETSAAAEADTEVPEMQGEDGSVLIPAWVLAVRLSERLPVLQALPEVHRLPRQVPARDSEAFGAGVAGDRDVGRSSALAAADALFHRPLPHHRIDDLNVGIDTGEVGSVAVALLGGEMVLKFHLVFDDLANALKSG